MIEHLQTNTLLEIKRASLNEQGEFTCYASTFGFPADDVNDVIERGAFRTALAEHKAADTTPAMLWSHDQSEPIGKWLSLEEDQHGLRATGKFTLGTKRGAEAFALLKDDAVRFSIGFIVANGGSRITSGVRHITKISRLAEISLVAIPANPRAKLIAENKRNFERFLRYSGGLSRKDALRTSAGIWESLTRDDDKGFKKLDRFIHAIECLTTTVIEE